MPTTSTKPPTRPAAAKAPTDRRPTAEQLQAEALNERPDGADLLRAPGSLRARERSLILNLATSLTADAEAFAKGLDADASAADQVQAVSVGFELVATIDELLEERFATDPDAYASWGTLAGGGANPDGRIVELFTWYANSLGE